MQSTNHHAAIRNDEVGTYQVGYTENSSLGTLVGIKDATVSTPAEVILFASMIEPGPETRIYFKPLKDERITIVIEEAKLSDTEYDLSIKLPDGREGIIKLGKKSNYNGAESLRVIVHSSEGDRSRVTLTPNHPTRISG